MQVIMTQQHQDLQGQRRKKAAKPRKLPAWRPEPNGLSRDELRRIVLDTLG